MKDKKPVKIDPRTLNFVFNVEDGDGNMVQVHSLPLNEDPLEQYILPLSKTYYSALDNGASFMGAQRVLLSVLSKEAQLAGVWRIEDERGNAAGLERDLLGEIVRLSHVIQKNESGKTISVRLDEVTDKKLKRNALAAIVFFTLASCVNLNRAHYEAVMGVIASIPELGLQRTSLHATAWIDSLAKSTEGKTTSATTEEFASEQGPTSADVSLPA